VRASHYTTRGESERLTGILSLPPAARGVVVLVHAGERSAPDQKVSDALVDAGFGTVQIDLPTPDEESDDPDAQQHFGQCVVQAIEWLDADSLVGDLPPRLRELPLGCFGAGPGAAAVLVAAAARPHRVAAVVCLGGRPELAGTPEITAPTLLIAAERVPTEPERVAARTSEWFERHLAPQRQAAHRPRSGA
jgi:putative phosphoribosyl transferase